MPESITALLSRVCEGDREALEDLVPLVYEELHQLAQGYLRRERPNHTLQPTALIHEAYIRLVESAGPKSKDRAHFFGIAARVMRQILVDHARAHRASKRAALKFSLDESIDFTPERDRVVVALGDALNALAKEDERKAHLVEMRFFAGTTAEEIADCVAMPVHTVRRELRIAQSWLRREMES